MGEIVSNGSRLTEKQHYIPQVYLRGFSPEYSRKRENYSKSKYTIYCHNINGKKQCLQAVPIKSICYKKNLYEITGNQEEVLFPNYLERFFSAIENMFGNYRDKLERKAFLESNYYTRCFLTREEKAFWVTFIIIQILRLPQTLNIAEVVSRKTLGEEINVKQAKNIARILCLPFFRELEEESKELFVFNKLFEPMKTMSFGVGVDREKKVITSDKPVYILAEKFPCDEYEEIIFPISSELCLFLFGGEYKEHYHKNFLFSINDEMQEVIFKAMVSSTFGNIFSNHCLDKIERRYIKEVMRGGEM